ncbi:GNAT family N-acetyltransferase [Bacillus sp. JJ722]|uniref:GNAT family N-acetyltransferase n=1 Tax=Bacillus sp. JJ722 TaxID=3122973 RepID=UPI002FFFCA0B
MKTNTITTLKHFNDLTKEQLYKILSERVAVFVVEQEYPYPEIDGLDPFYYHLIQENDKDIMAYLRIIPSNDKKEFASLGRVLVKKDYRGHGLATELVQRGINYCLNELGEKQIKIQAQSYLKDFYSSLGFSTMSEEYLEDNIPHIDMILTTEK